MKSPKNCFKYMGKVYGIHKVAELKDDYYLKLHQFKLYPSVTALIDNLAENQIPIGIVTVAHKDRILKTYILIVHI